MWNISYHGNYHFNSTQSPKNPPHPLQDKLDVGCYQAYMQNALEDYQDGFTKLAFLSYNNNTPIPPCDIEPIRATTHLIMLYIAAHLLATGGAPISKSQMKILFDQAEKCAVEFVQAKSVQPSLKSAQASDLVSPMQAAIAPYTTEIHATINKHHDSVLQLLKLSATIKLLPNLSTHCNKLWGTSFPIISGLATLITHLSGEEISAQELKILTHHAKYDALELHTTPMPPKMPSPPPVFTTRNAPLHQVPQYPILPPGQIKSSLKTGKIHPVIARTPPLHKIKSTSAEPDNKEDDPGIYSKTIDRDGDGTHLITTSFIKTNDKIRDQVLTKFVYFSDLMHANIDRLKIHPISTKKPLPILTSPKDKNIPTTGNKIRDYFFIQNQYSLVPRTWNKQKPPPQKVDFDSQFQFDENRQYNGPDRIIGIMLIIALGNVKQAIGNLLIKLKGDAHQIRYKPTQRKK
jgi:hypothetical protein